MRGTGQFGTGQFLLLGYAKAAQTVLTSPHFTQLGEMLVGQDVLPAAVIPQHLDTAVLKHTHRDSSSLDKARWSHMT